MEKFQSENMYISRATEKLFEEAIHDEMKIICQFLSEQKFVNRRNIGIDTELFVARLNTPKKYDLWEWLISNARTYPWKFCKAIKILNLSSKFHVNKLQCSKYDKVFGIFRGKGHVSTKLAAKQKIPFAFVDKARNLFWIERKTR